MGLALAVALLAVQTISVRWTPDCGGLAYGVPLRYVQASMHSSMTYSFSPLPLAVDLAAYALVLLPLTTLLERVMGRRSRSARWTARSLPLLAGLVGAGYLALVVGIGAYRPFHSGRGAVYEWHSLRVAVEWPDWDFHLEDRCN